METSHSHSRILIAVVLAALLALGLWAWLAPARSVSEPARAAAPAAVQIQAERPEARTEPAPALAIPAAATPTERVELDEDSAGALLRGRVVDAEGGAPLAGVEVALVAFRDTLASVHSDADGGFRLPFESGPGRNLEVRPAQGWKALDSRQRVRGEQATEREFLFELRRVRAAPVLLRLVDAADGEPLPELEVELRHGVRTERALSDGDGRLTTPDAWEATRLQVQPVGADGRSDDFARAQFEHAGEGGEQELALEVGPTYALRVAVPVGYELDDLRAWLDSREFRRRPAADRAQRVHAGAPPWVRFLRSDINWGLEETPWRLHVATDDLAWIGSAEVETTAGRAPGVVEVLLSARGSVNARVLDSGGAALLAGYLSVSPRDGHAHEGPAYEGPGGAQVEYGLARLDGLTPGAYTATVFEDRHEPERVELQVRAGAVSEIQFTMRPLPSAGGVTGRVRSQRGEANFLGYVALRGATPDAAHFLSSTLEWSGAHGQAVGRFAFADVPPGEYELVTAGYLGSFPWSPANLRVSPPMNGIDLVYLDDAPGVDLVLEVVDARSGAFVEDFEIRLGAEFGSSWTHGFSGADRTRLGRHPDDAGLRWHAQAAGYRSTSGRLGDATDIRQRKGEPLRLLRVELEPGWGGLLHVVKDRAPLPDALVSCDGVELGRTGPDGTLILALPAVPERLRVDCQGCGTFERDARFPPVFFEVDFDALPEGTIQMGKP